MEKLIISFLGSWKTTVVGVVVGLFLILTQIKFLVDGDPGTVFNGTSFLEGLAVLGIGSFAKDGDKRSEDLGL